MPATVESISGEECCDGTVPLQQRQRRDPRHHFIKHGLLKVVAELIRPLPQLAPGAPLIRVLRRQGAVEIFPQRRSLRQNVSSAVARPGAKHDHDAGLVH